MKQLIITSILILSFINLFLITNTFAQNVNSSTTCKQALQQLQMYINTVNRMYWQYITYINTHFYPAFRPQQYYQVNFWYNNESVKVNNYYMQICRSCQSIQSNNPLQNSTGLPTTTAGSTPNTNDNTMDPKSIPDSNSLPSDISNKKVTIKIPSTPSGWNN